MLPDRLVGRLPQALVAAGGLVFLALVWIGLLFHLEQRREGEVVQARRDVLNLSIALAEQVSRLIEGVDQVMRLIQADYADDPKAFDFATWSKRATMLTHSARQMAIFDETGDLVVARDPLPFGIGKANVSDRAYFRPLADHPDSALYVGRTLRGRLMDSWAFTLARRLSRPDGSFAGVLVVAVDPDYVARRFEALDVGAGASVALLGRDGYVRVREPALPGMYERDLSVRSDAKGLFASLSQAPAGIYEVDSGLDGRSRIFGYRTTEGLPLLVTVGKSVDAVLAPLVAERRNAFALGAAASGFILLGCLVLLRELERRRRREALLIETHRALGEAETLFRGVFEHATDHLFVHGVAPDGSFALETLNPSAAALIGCSAEDVRGKTPEDVMPADMAAIVRADIEGVIRSGEPMRRQEERVRGDGTHRFEVILVPLREAGGGRIGRVFISVRDITHLRRAEEAIAQSEARYRALADSLPQLVWITRAEDGEAAYVNQRFEAYYGPIGTGRAARIAANHPGDAERMETAWDAAVRADRGYEAEGRLRRHDGTHRWHKIVVMPIREGGAIVGWLGTALDIDDIITARRTLEETSDLLRLAQDAAEAGSWDLDLLSGAVLLSPESARLHGLATTQPLHLTIDAWKALVMPEDQEHAFATATEAIASRRTFAVEVRVTGGDGGVRWLQSIGRAYYDPAGRPVRVIGLNLDATERKHAELTLQAAKTAAEAARLEAERASLAKTDFLAAMSHEIRTPLNAVIGFTDLLARSERLAPDLQRHAELARSSGSALLTVVNDILDFSKVEAGAIDLEQRAFAPTALADNGLSIVRGLAAAKGLVVISRIDPGLPGTLVGDEARLRQILLNLLNNAVKFTRRGTITLSVRHAGTTPDGETIRFSVTDTGIGIPLAKQHRLFERFSQVDNSVSRDFGGTGLGLAISRRLVELMGGTIGVASDDGEGSTFWFTVTLPRSADVTTPAVAQPVAEPRATGHILLVEDVEINQELARLVLEAVGHTVDVVADGAAAVMAVEDGAFDLVLMDVQMPGMDGITATRMIRRLKGPSANVPVIAMTANVLPAEVRRFREAGMDDHVGKPFDRAVLYATVARWLSGRDGAEGAAAERRAAGG